MVHIYINWCLWNLPHPVLKSSDAKFCSFCLSPPSPPPCCLPDVTPLVSCCGYRQNMMQGRAVSEKHVAGGSALPGEHLTLIASDEGRLHSGARSGIKLRSEKDTVESTWWTFLQTDKTATLSCDFWENRCVLYVQPLATNDCHKDKGRAWTLWTGPQANHLSLTVIRWS